MTQDDFANRIKRQNSFDRYWSYFMSIGIMGIGLYFLYLLSFTEWFGQKEMASKSEMPIEIAYFFSVMFILLGLYGLWRIPKSYELTKIPSDFSVDKKVKVINQLVNEIKLVELERESQYRHFRYKGRFWNSFDIYIFYNTNSFYLNTQQMDFGDGGFIDFGTSKRVTRRIKNKIIDILNFHFASK